MTQNAYLAKTSGVKRRLSFQDRRGFVADKKQTGKEIKTGNAGGMRTEVLEVNMPSELVM